MKIIKHPTFLCVKVAQLLCVAYILVLTFTYAPFGLRDISTGNIIDSSSPTNTSNGVIYINGSYRPIVAIGTFELVCLGISRSSAFSLYPVIILVFFSKCKATLNYLEKTPISMFMINNSHKLHSYCGWYIAIDVWIHTIFHLLRWSHQGNIQLLLSTAAGLSGLIAVVVAPLITFFMICCKQRISYEVRKSLHYLFYVFAIALCFHVPPTGIPNGGFIAYVLGGSICMYTFDRLYIIFRMTERIDTSQFQVLPSGVYCSLAVSSRFQANIDKGGFGYICLPWVDRQWHAFSLFQDPNDPAKRVVFMLNVGDWTNKVHSELTRCNTSRPVWIQGPYVSPWKQARDFDNQILVSTGIGITPALSVIEAHKESRTIFLLWSTRDATMIEFFLEQYHYLDHKLGYNFIFYTGKEQLHPSILEGLPSNVEIIQSRPNLEALIPDIIHANECGRDDKHLRVSQQTATDFQPCKQCQVIHNILEKTKGYDVESSDDTSHSTSSSTEERLQELVDIASDAGYNFTDLSNHLSDAGIPCPFTTPKTKRRGSLSRFIPNTTDPNLVLERVCHLAGIWQPTIHAKRSIKQGIPRSLLSRWGIMYCGASKQVKQSVKDISNDYGIDLHYESFAW